ncbi:putative polysaccharide biosynthesis protein [Pseudogracilibacillus auburnensis]|uniref:putative polysaccharide biosynthesis protein n=1 Tax=Pseudogracilibacillus auburnensis TaxID=1494959 RepID=UPI001A96B308|nr:oligosaccharide flippase family protein [Pseudogracilibacillus auburnensis]MBO1004717.1 oligosaccharide flippase family protein [Pseudogracilibacillus auburnensis]
MPYDKSNRYIQGAVILMAATFIVKLLSAVYRIPFQNIVGDIGFYIYQQVYPIYGIAMILATSGFPVIISRIVAEGEGSKQKDINQNLQAAFLTIVFVGVICFCIFFFGATFIATMMGDLLLAPLIKSVSIIFLFLPFLSVWRGYFQGVGNMIPTAYSQVTEQLIRVPVILLLAYFLLANGYSLYVSGLGAIVGSVFGMLAGVVLLIIFAAKDRIIRPLFVKGLSFKKFNSIAQIVLVHGTAICFSSMLLILFQLVDSFSLYRLLVNMGTEVELAKGLKGIFDRGQPLIQLGTVAATSFALALVPLIAKAAREDNLEVVKNRIISALKISIVVGFGAAVGLANIMKPTNIMLFENADGSLVLAVLAFSILFSSISIVTTGILQGLGHFFAPVKYILVGILIKSLGNYFLVPLLGTLGAAISTIIGLLIITILLVAKVNKRVQLGKLLVELTKKMSLAAVSMTVILQLWLAIFELIDLNDRFGYSIAALTGVAMGAAIYLLVVIRIYILSEEEMTLLPFGNRLNDLFSKRR